MLVWDGRTALTRHFGCREAQKPVAGGRDVLGCKAGAETAKGQYKVSYGGGKEEGDCVQIGSSTFIAGQVIIRGMNPVCPLQMYHRSGRGGGREAVIAQFCDAGVFC